MAVQIISGASSTIATVDTTSAAVRASIYDTNGNNIAVQKGTAPSTPTGIISAGLSDGSNVRLARVDKLGNNRSGLENMIFNDRVEGTTINTQIWTASTSTLTQAQLGTTGINFNSASAVTASAYSILTSQKQFCKMQGQPLKLRMRARVVGYVNSVIEWGWCAPTTTTAQIVTGCYWRYTSGGTIVPVISYNSADTVQGTDITAAITAAGGTGNYYNWLIWVDDDQVYFGVQNSVSGAMIAEQTLQIPATQPKTWSTTHCNIAARVYNTASAPATAPLFFLSDVMALAFDIMTNKPWSHQVVASSGLGQETIPTTCAASMNWTNSTAPTSATLSNTAAGYTTLGGLYGFAAVAGAVTDYALFGYTVPAPYSFYCTGVHIEAYNTGAAVATSATLMHWALCPNSAAVTLVTAGIRPMFVGSQSFAIGAAIGATATPIDVSFDVPLKTEPGRIFHVLLRMPVGTATASQVIQGSVMLKGYFE
jgi:hypothetical protein